MVRNRSMLQKSENKTFSLPSKAFLIQSSVHKAH